MIASQSNVTQQQQLFQALKCELTILDV